MPRTHRILFVWFLGYLAGGVSMLLPSAWWGFGCALVSGLIAGWIGDRDNQTTEA